MGEWHTQFQRGLLDFYQNAWHRCCVLMSATPTETQEEGCKNGTRAVDNSCVKKKKICLCVFPRIVCKWNPDSLCCMLQFTQKHKVIKKNPHVSLSFPPKQNRKTVDFPSTLVAAVSFPGLPDCYMPETKRAPRGLDPPFPGCVRRGRLHMRVSEQELTRNRPGSDNSNWEPQLSAL